MRKILFIIAASYLLINIELLAQTGQTGLSFLKLGVGGRALGMGEAYSAIASDPTATHYNPAALARSDYPQVHMMHKEWIQDMKTDFLSVSTSLNNFSFGISVNITSVNDIPLRKISGPPIGTFDSRNAAFGISGAYKIDPSLSFGITTKYLYEKILVDEATGYAVDLGGLYQTPWDVRFAFVVNNLGSMNALDKEASKLPTSIRVGGAYQLGIESMNGNITFATDVVSFTLENKSHLYLGTEFDYSNLIAVRFGYQTGYEAKSFSTGIGIHYGMLQLDYAFVPFQSDLGSTHTISLGFEFK